MTWTKFSERLPEELADEVFVIARPGGAPFVAKRGSLRTWKDWSHCYAWHIMTYPEVPKEESQLDRDREAMFAKYASKSLDHGLQVSRAGEVDTQYYEGWLEGIAYERAEVAKDIKTLVFSVALPQHSAALDRLRRRVGLDK